MSRKSLPRLAGAAATVAALVAALTAIAGTGFAQTAAQAAYAPKNTAAPTISGTPQVGQTLTASPGTWTSDTTPTYTYQWQRCNAQGANCVALAGATNQTYVVQAADTGSTLRVVVTATNASGASSATSAQTAVVTASSGGVAGRSVITAAQADRLVIDRVSWNPRRLDSRTAFSGRIHVSDTRGVSVQDALVKVIGLPYSWARNTAEARTDGTGWATVTVEPTANLPLGKRAALVMFLRARTEGQNLLAGNSTRRLVQIRVR